MSEPSTKKPKLKQQKDANGFRVRPVTKIAEESVHYRIEGELRKLDPYYHTYQTYCKKRWREMKLLDIFASEFRDKPKEYYKWVIERGQVLVNDKVASCDTVVHDSDLIKHTTHKHEPPVSGQDVQVLFQNDNVVVVNKPGGLPAHPTGRYRHNTVVGILKHSKGIPCHPCNRLDRLTSGLMFLAKTSAGSKIMFDQLTQRQVEKFYIARVKGNFPLGDKIVDKPLMTVAPQLSLNRVMDVEDGGKESSTLFRKLSYDSATDTSIVKCKPLTGRTHQIRVHLQYLGHPIANDPIYSNPSVWGPDLGKSGKADYTKISEELQKVGKTVAATSWYYQTIETSPTEGEILTGEKCDVCQTELYTDPNPNDLELWLHAYQYQTKATSESEKPSAEAAEDAEMEKTTDSDSEKKSETAEPEPKSVYVNEYSTVDKDFKKWCFKTPLPAWALASSRRYMEMAVAEAAKCGPTTTAFSVGAVLVDSNTDTVLARGYSRELPGNTHAEQNALTKFYEANPGAELPEGTVLYTTMEPCSLRLSGNQPCVDRILATKGRIMTCFVGVFEPKTFVQNNIGYEKLVQNGVEYFHIPGYEEEILKIAFKGHEKQP